MILGKQQKTKIGKLDLTGIKTCSPVCPASKGRRVSSMGSKSCKSSLKGAYFSQYIKIFHKSTEKPILEMW
jgi:hypothetical protein